MQYFASQKTKGGRCQKLYADTIEISPKIAEAQTVVHARQFEKLSESKELKVQMKANWKAIKKNQRYECKGVLQ